MRRPAALFALVLCLAFAGCATRPAKVADATLILVSLDGFRWDYLEKFPAPTLRALARDGVRVTRLVPSFPTKTFPNHYTLVTGLRPEHHGIVGNWFYDPARGETFGMHREENNTESHWWAGGEPVWITAERQGVRSFCYFWPGSETENRGLRPSRYKKYDEGRTSAQRVTEMLEWLDTPPAARPGLCALYFDSVDTAGHRFGPDAPETAAAVAEVDAALAQLLAGLERLGLREKTNLVVVSDHGMSSCDPDQVIFFEDLMDVSRVQIDATGPVGGVRAKDGPGATAALVAAIRAKAPPQLRVYRREEMPPAYHYRDNPRIPDILLIADDHWNIERRVGWPVRKLTYNRGTHGWDPATPNMGATLLAAGPAFRRGVTLASAENVDVYRLLCETLGIAPSPNDGGDRLARAALRR